MNLYYCLRNIHLIMVLHQLNDDSYVIGVVLDGYNPHDVRGIFCIRILAVFVG